MIERILARLARGPASESDLGRFCDLTPARKVRPLICRLLRDGAIARAPGDRFALPPNPLSPAARITVPGYRWGATRLA